MSDFTKLHSTLKDVPLAKMRVCDLAQRDLKQARVAKLAAEFDPEMFGYPVVNLREGHFYVIDGQHRVEAVKAWLGDEWEKQAVTCRTYSGMTEQDEAKMFLALNDALVVGAFAKFKVAVTAGKQTQCAVKKIVEKCGLKISADKSDGSVGAVTILVTVYNRTDAPTLARTLRIVNESFGTPGLTSFVIDGVSRVCARYNGALDDAVAVDRLSSMRKGIDQLMGRAGLLRKQTGVSLAECVAAATVDVINAKRGGKKLPSWWKES